MSAAIVMDDRPRVSWTTFMSCPAAKLQQGRGPVAQVVQPDGRQPGEVGDHVEGVSDGSRMQRAAQLVGELEPGIGPGVCGGFLLLVLILAPAAMSATVSVSVSVSIVRSPALDLGTPWTASHPSWVICQRTVVTPSPRSVSGWRSPQPSSRRSPRVAISRHSACSRCRRGGVEEDRGLGGGPDHDRGRARDGDQDVDRADPPACRPGGGQRGVEVALPGADPCGSPDQGLGPVAGGQLDQRGGLAGSMPGCCRM